MMKYFSRHCMILSTVFLLSFLMFESSCDRDSSPEGRMSIKLEALQKEMIDSLRQQNKAMLDSLGKIREEIEALKQPKK
jgi:hypothetical protein